MNPEFGALEDLYHSTGGAGWTSRGNWLNGDPCLNLWDGVSCDSTKTHITALTLTNNNLVGSLPASLSDLTALQSLNLYANQLTGSIPDLSGMTGLESVILSGNQLSGPIPSLAGLTQLAWLDLARNRLTGTIPELTGMTALRDVFLGNNRLSGALPSLVGLAGLRTFQANDNQLTGSIPSLTGLVALSDFRVHNNQLTGTIPDLTGLNSLWVFRVENNYLSGSVPIAPTSLVKNLSALCPNHLTPAATPPTVNDNDWNRATGITPWSRDCVALASSVAAIPTLGEWALVALAALLLGMSARRLCRTRTRPIDGKSSNASAR